MSSVKNATKRATSAKPLSKDLKLGAAYRDPTGTRGVKPTMADLEALIDSFEAKADVLDAKLSITLKRLGV